MSYLLWTLAGIGVLTTFGSFAHTLWRAKTARRGSNHEGGDSEQYALLVDDPRKASRGYGEQRPAAHAATTTRHVAG